MSLVIKTQVLVKGKPHVVSTVEIPMSDEPTFETMVFKGATHNEVLTRRYRTPMEAMAGHYAIVESYRDQA
jgi:hypothetical protein